MNSLCLNVCLSKLDFSKTVKPVSLSQLCADVFLHLWPTAAHTQANTHTYTQEASHHSNMCKHTGGWWKEALPLTQMHTSCPSIHTHSRKHTQSLLYLQCCS